MNRIRRIAEMLLERYPERFTDSFEHNKKELDKIAIITSKQLRNELAGYITHRIKMMKRTKELKTV